MNITEAPQEIIEAVEELQALETDIEFPNHSNYPAEWLTLATLTAPKGADIATNNCHAVTFETLRAITETIGYDYETGTAEIVFRDGCHWTLVLQDSSGVLWALDYTARQFGATLPAPYVAPLPDWINHIAALVGERNLEVSCYLSGRRVRVVV